MTDKKSRWSTDKKARIVLQTFNPQASMAEICREYNLVPRLGCRSQQCFEKSAGGRARMNAARTVYREWWDSLMPLLCGVFKKAWYCTSSPRNVSPDPEVQ